MIKSKYDLIFIGTGPATIFSCINLVQKGYKGNILIIEQGDSLLKRDKKEICFGFGGAGCFSDFKISWHPTSGGALYSYFKQDYLDNLSYKIIEYINLFKEEGWPELKFTESKDYDSKFEETGIKFIKNKVCHLGTDRGYAWLTNVFNYLSIQENIQFLFKNKIISIEKGEKEMWVLQNEKGENFFSEKVILATGPRGNLLKEITEKFNLQTKEDNIQIGIRVEDENTDGKYNEILSCAYDFKFRKEFPLGNVRTFCCNSGGGAKIAKEENGGEFISWNGHAEKNPQNPNNKVNYGIINSCRLEEFDKNTQIELCKSINKKYPNSPYSISKVAEVLPNAFPPQISNPLINFISHFKKIININSAQFYIPEIKLINKRVQFSNNFKIYNNLYAIGDLIVSRGILQAGMSGLIFSEGIL